MAFEFYDGGWQHVAIVSPVNRVENARNDAWGHLKPKHRKRYHGTMLFSYMDSTYNMMSSDFEDLGDPWSYDDISAFFDYDFCERDLEEGIYLWRGYYTRFASGKHRFVGEYKRLETESLIAVIDRSGSPV